MTVGEKVKKLGMLPLHAVIDLAKEIGIGEDELERTEKNNIIQRIVTYPSLKDDYIENKINDYIYGNKVTFTLWSFERNLNESEYDKVIGLRGVTENDLKKSSFRNLRIPLVEQHKDRFEVVFVYSKEYNYIDEAENTSSVWELHKGCLWIGIDRSYIACISKHDAITRYIISSLSQKLSMHINQIIPPKSAITRCIKYKAMSRISLQSSDGGKTIVSKADGFTDEQKKEINSIIPGRFNTSGSYIAEITDKTYGTIKYNTKKGSIGIYKHMPASVLFSWTNQAINIILEEIDKLKGKTSEEIFAELGLAINWHLLKTDKVQALNWLLTQVIIMQSKSEEATIRIPKSVINILYEPSLFIKILRVYCYECDSYDIPICSECGKTVILDEKGTLKCSCKAVHDMTCGESHSKCKKAFWYIPTEKLKVAIENNYKKAFQGQEIKFNMCVMDEDLYICKMSVETDSDIEVMFDQIKEFKQQNKKDELECKNFAVRLNEKCNGTCSYDKIKSCIESNKTVCLPKIFYGVIPNYRPQPHKGLEYGDVSGQLHYSGKNAEFKGIIKKNTENKGKNGKDNSSLLSKPLLFHHQKKGKRLFVSL